MSGDIVGGKGLLEALEGGRYVEALKLVLDRADEASQPARQRSTIATRKAELAKAVEAFDVEKLVEIQEQMQSYVDRIARVFMEEPRKLAPAEVHQMMVEFLDNKTLDEFLEMRKEALRSLVFAHIDTEAREKGKDPAATNGVVQDPELGKEFRREGAGYKSPTLDHGVLKSLLGERASTVFVEETIPAQVVEKLDEEALMKMAQDDPTVMELIRQALVPGGYKAARFKVYDIKEK